MRTQRCRRKFTKMAMAVPPLVGALWVVPCLGQTLTWDSSGSNPLTPADGSGNWNTTTDANWSNGAANSTWVNGNVPSIGSGGVAGIVTINDISGTVSAGGINFNPVSSGSYTVAWQTYTVLMVLTLLPVLWLRRQAARPLEPVAALSGAADG